MDLYRVHPDVVQVRHDGLLEGVVDLREDQPTVDPCLQAVQQHVQRPRRRQPLERTAGVPEAVATYLSQ